MKEWYGSNLEVAESRGAWGTAFTLSSTTTDLHAKDNDWVSVVIIVIVIVISGDS